MLGLQEFLMAQSTRLVVVIEYQKDKMVYIEIDNFQIDKSLWEIKPLFDPVLIDNILLVYADYQYVWNEGRLTDKQKDGILVHIKNKYYTDLKRRNEKLEAEIEYYINIVRQLQDELNEKGKDRRYKK